MAEMGAGEGDRDMVAIKLGRQHALRRKRYAGWKMTLGGIKAISRVVS
jgi:hypothetical protein